MQPLAPTSWARKLFLEARANVLSNLPAPDDESFPPLACAKASPVLNPLEDNLAPYILTADDLDESNTRLFVKSLSPELHDYSFLHRVFRAFGKIRMLALNSKRHNVIVEFETKAAALAAKRDCRCVSALSGRTYTIKMFWGKHINREPPVKNAPPNFSEQIELVRQVDAEITVELTAPIPTSYLRSMLGLFGGASGLPSREENILEENSDLPPGLGLKEDDMCRWFADCDVDQENIGYYPLRQSHEWFKAPETFSFSRVSRPLTPVMTPTFKLERTWSPSQFAKRGIAGLLSASDSIPREPFSNFEKWESPSAASSLSASSPSLLETYSSDCYVWEVKTEMASFGMPLNEAPNKSASTSSFGSLPPFYAAPSSPVGSNIISAHLLDVENFNLPTSISSMFHLSGGKADSDEPEPIAAPLGPIEHQAISFVL